MWAASVLRERAGNGSGSLTLEPLDTIASPYHLSGKFDLGKRGAWLDGDSFAIPSGLRVLGRPGDFLAGPLGMRDLPAAEPTPCYAGHEDETLTLTLPQGRVPERLPADRTASGSGFSYHSHYAFADGKVTVERSFETSSASRSAPAWREWKSTRRSRLSAVTKKRGSR